MMLKNSKRELPHFYTDHHSQFYIQPRIVKKKREKKDFHNLGNGVCELPDLWKLLVLSETACEAK